MHGVMRTIQEIRERGVPGFEVEVIGTDPGVDRRLSSVTEVEVPFYPGLKLGVPSLSASVDALADGQYDLIHLVTPGPAGIAASLLARVLEMPRVGSYHTEFAAYAQVRSARAGVETIARAALGQFYGPCKVVLSPSAATDARLQEMGISEERIGRWDRGVDHRCFSPVYRTAALLPGDITVLYAGRLTKEKGVDLLADGFLAARRRDPRLHLVLAGGGPEEHHLRARLEGAGTFLGWLAGDELARAYASADMFLFASQTDTFGQVISEAQASGLPVVAVADGGPAGLIEHGETGLLVSAQADRLAEAVLSLAHDRQLRERIGTAAVAAARSRTWTRSLEQLAAGYLRALKPPAAKVSRRRPDASSRAAA
jgi:glycosyltransferase involved in cell wall biosynthesis